MQNSREISKADDVRCSQAIRDAVQFLGYSPFFTEPKQTIGEEIRDYRLIHGLSQKKLAKALGIDPTTLAQGGRRIEANQDQD